jgi:hypothetical protein
MTVRKITKSTLSVVFLITGFIFFRLHYIELLARLMNSMSGNDGYFSIISERLLPDRYIGNYFPSLFYFCVIIIIAACLINAILDYKVALKMLSSFSFPLFLAVIVTAALCIIKINILQLWAIFYACIIICLHSTFKKLILHSEFAGSHANLKLINGFISTIKNIILKIISTGCKNFSNPVDEITILLASSLVLLLEVAALFSYIIYIIIHWRLIFYRT